LEPVLAVLETAGAEQLAPIQPTPVGRKTRFRHADGLIVEYVDRRMSTAQPRAPGWMIRDARAAFLTTRVCYFP
jgi:hypothetical protein